MSLPQLALTPRERMVKMLQAFLRIYRREHGDLSNDDLSALYDLLACYMSELHDDCLSREVTVSIPRKKRAKIPA